jgi:hypothetical protein
MLSSIALEEIYLFETEKVAESIFPTLKRGANQRCASGALALAARLKLCPDDTRLTSTTVSYG